MRHHTAIGNFEHALNILGVSQRSAVEGMRYSQSDLSRAAKKAWQECKPEMVIAILGSIAEKAKMEAEFTVEKMEDGRVSSVMLIY